MRSERKPDGGLTLELDAKEARLLRFLAERASFMDTPPEEQEPTLQLAEEILAALGYETER